MYQFTLSIHSILRWVILILMLLAIFRSFSGWFGKQEWTASHRKTHLFTLISIHLQFVLGFVLYFVLSPYVSRAFSNMKGAMKEPILRFWTVEHTAMMVLAIIFFQIGYSRSKRLSDSIQRHKTAAIFYTISLVLMLASIPWPFRKVAREWIRLPW